MATESDDNRKVAHTGADSMKPEGHTETPMSRVEILQTPIGFVAVHEDYDGPEDITNIGYGSTSEEAREDLRERRAERKMA